jgi:hypothetical protein
MRQFVASAGFVLSFLVPAGAAGAQSTGLEDMVGARAGQAEGELQRRGYAFIRAETGDDRSYTYWWNARRQQCVTIATMDGRYASVQPTPPPDCRQSGNARPDPGYGGVPASRPRPGYEPDPRYGRPGYDQGGYTDDRPMVDGRDVDLGLVCFGDGSKTGLATGTTWRWNRSRDRYEYDRYSETQREVFDASITIQTWPGGGRIRLPKSLIPPINSRGSQGWWDLENVSIGPDTVNATYRLNGLNKPRISIDRRSGRITIRGTGDYGFRGTCDQIAHGTRRF